MIISFFVEGIPTPQGSKTAFRKGNKTILIDGGSADAHKRNKAWRKAVLERATQIVSDGIGNFPLDEPTHLSLFFYFDRPKSQKKAGPWKSTTPDVSKLIRSVEDSLQGPLLVNDSRIVSVHAYKMYIDGTHPKPGCLVRLSTQQQGAVE